MMYLTSDDLPDLEPGERLLVESTGVNQLPDLRPELDLFYSFESMLNTALYLERDIEAMGGMSRSLAMEMYEVWPALAEKRPLAYYTTQPSQTLLTVALEEIHLGIAAGIAAAVAALIAAIYKLWKWIRGGEKDGHDGITAARNDRHMIEDEGKEAGEAAKVLEEVAHDLQALPQDEVKEVATATEDKAVEHSKQVHNAHDIATPVVDNRSSLISAALKLVSSRNLRLVERFGTEEFLDLYHEGEWSKAVFAAVRQFRERQGELEQRLKALSQVSAMDPTKLSDADAHHIHGLVGGQHQRSESDDTFAQLAEHAEDLHRKKREAHHHETIAIGDIGRRIEVLSGSHAMHEIFELRTAILQMGSAFTELEHKLKPYTDEATLKHVFDSDKHSDAAHAIRNLTSEVMFLNRMVGTYYSMVVHYITAVKQYSSNYNTLVNLIEKTVIADVNQLGRTAADKAKAEGVVARLKKRMFRKK